MRKIFLSQVPLLKEIVFPFFNLSGYPLLLLIIGLFLLGSFLQVLIADYIVTIEY